MLILSIDCAGSGCGVCVARDGQNVAMKREPMARGQDGRLVPLIEEIMAEAHANYEDLDRIAVTRGPGSFTGLRIALATARGIGLAAGKPVFGIDRFSILERQIPSRPLLSVIDSRRAEFFCRLALADGTKTDPVLMDSNKIKELLETRPEIKIAGDGALSLGAATIPVTEDEVVTAAELASEAVEGAVETLPRPLYLRAPDVTMPCKK